MVLLPFSIPAEKGISGVLSSSVGRRKKTQPGVRERKTSAVWLSREMATKAWEQ
jgi:hypothetical protein